MKKHYTKPITRCLFFKVGSGLLQSSILTSEKRSTNESFSRRTTNDDWDDWDE